MSDTFIMRGKTVFVAGHTGLVGSALCRYLAQTDNRLVTAEKSRLDLRKAEQTNAFIASQKPDLVLLAAAKVGGIEANRTQPVEFLFDNTMIAFNVIKACADNNVPRLMNLASNCYYPREAEQPIHEHSLLTGPLEPTNEAYALAKISAAKLCEYYSQQYNKSFFTLVPTSLYGPGDHFSDERGHVIPAMIRRFHEAKIQGLPSVTLWGTGSPEREFLYIDDAVKGMMYFCEHYHGREPVNLCGGHSISIRTLAQSIADVVGFSGELRWDTSKPDGMPKKALSPARCFDYEWRPKVSFTDGLRLTYQDFIARA